MANEKETKKSKKKSSDQGRKLNIYRFICLILMVVLIVVLLLWAKDYLLVRDAQQQYTNLQNQVNNVSVDRTDDAGEQETESEAEKGILDELGITIPEKNLDWEMLRETNADIYAWIYIPGTAVDYPILQHPSDDDYYLDHNMDGSKGRPGCIYTQMLNSKDFTDYNTVIYGHNMKSGAMFRTLHDFEDAAFFEEHPYFYIYTENGVLVYEIFAAYVADNSHILNTNDFSTETGYDAYLTKVFANTDESANFRQDVTVTTDNRIVTLSTCASGGSSRRYLVQGVLLNEENLPETGEPVGEDVDDDSNFHDAEVDVEIY